MGFCWSNEEKKKEENKHSVRTRRTRTSSLSREDTNPIFIRPTKGERNGVELDQQPSYTDKAMVEQEVFRQIISRTARDLIDVSPHLTPLLEEERAMRKKLYRSKVLNVHCDSKGLFELPAASASNTSSLLRTPNPIEEHQQFIDKSIKQIAQAWAETKEVCDFGRVVVPFDDFSA